MGPLDRQQSASIQRRSNHQEHGVLGWSGLDTVSSQGQTIAQCLAEQQGGDESCQDVQSRCSAHC